MSEIRTVVPKEIDAYLEALVRKGIFANKAELVRAALVQYVTQTGTIFKGFDSENIFSPDGRVYQLEYARESSAGGLTTVAMVCEDGILLAHEAHKGSRLTVPVLKIVRIGEKLAVTYSGLMADASVPVEELRAKTPKSTDEAIRVVREVYLRHTLSRTLRPLGASLLVASLLDRKPRLVLVDPSGATVEELAAAIGLRGEEVLAILESKYRRMKLADAEKLLPELFGKGVAFEALKLG